MKLFWQEHSEEIGFLLWMIAVNLICVIAWISADAAEALFR